MSTAEEPEANRPRRGRPPSAELAAQRRRDLVETAYAIFSEKGYTAAGVSDITDSLGVATGTFYRYFDSKRDILDAVIDFGVEKMMDAAHAALEPEMPETFDEFIAQVRRVGEAVMRTVDEEPGMVQMLLFEATAVDGELTARLLGLHDLLGTITASALDHGIEAGFVRPGIDTKVVGRAIYMLLSPSLVEMLRGPLGPEVRAQHLDAILDFALNGLKAQG
jgi:AcrR family transcriptional regulator